VTLLTLIDRGLTAGGSGILGGLICLLASRKHRVAAEQTRAVLQSELRSELGSELQSLMREHEVECSAAIKQAVLVSPSRDVDVVQPGARHTGEIGHGGLTRSVRSQAIQLLRSGMPPQGVASALGIGKREILLISSVLRTLTPQ
jgi:hypothetical protein